jgi:hypothetical protein
MHTEYVAIANQLRIYGPIGPNTIIPYKNIKHIVFDCSYETIAITCNNPEFKKIQTTTLIDVFIRTYDMDMCLAAATVLKSYKGKHKIIIHDLLLYLIVYNENKFDKFSKEVNQDIQNIINYALQVEKNKYFLNKTDAIFEPWYFNNTNFEQQKINPITKKRFQIEYPIKKKLEQPHVFLKEMTIDTLEDAKDLEKLGSYEYVHIDYIIGHRGLQAMCNTLLDTKHTFSIMKRLVIGTAFSPSSYMNAKSVELVKEVQMRCLHPKLVIVFNDPNMECIFNGLYQDIKKENVYREFCENNICYLQGYCSYFVPINVLKIEFDHSEITLILQDVFIQYNNIENKEWKPALYNALHELYDEYKSWTFGFRLFNEQVIITLVGQDENTGIQGNNKLLDDIKTLWENATFKTHRTVADKTIICTWSLEYDTKYKTQSSVDVKMSTDKKETEHEKDEHKKVKDVKDEEDEHKKVKDVKDEEDEHKKVKDVKDEEDEHKKVKDVKDEEDEEREKNDPQTLIVVTQTSSNHTSSNNDNLKSDRSDGVKSNNKRKRPSIVEEVEEDEEDEEVEEEEDAEEKNNVVDLSEVPEEIEVDEEIEVIEFKLTEGFVEIDVYELSNRIDHGLNVIEQHINVLLNDTTDTTVFEHKALLLLGGKQIAEPYIKKIIVDLITELLCNKNALLHFGCVTTTGTTAYCGFFENENIILSDGIKYEKNFYLLKLVVMDIESLINPSIEPFKGENFQNDGEWITILD